MSETQEQINEVEMSIADAKKAVQRRDAMYRLEKNKDFKALILEGFMEKHAVRQVMLKASPQMQSPELQAMVDMQITAIGQFKQFMYGVVVMGNNAEKAMEADEATLEELHAEELAGK
jgi:hypothetical protein